MNLHLPFNSNIYSELAEKITSQDYPPLNKSYSDSLRSLIALMLQKKVKYRPTIEQILKITETQTKPMDWLMVQKQKIHRIQKRRELERNRFKEKIEASPDKILLRKIFEIKQPTDEYHRRKSSMEKGFFQLAKAKSRHQAINGVKYSKRNLKHFNYKPKLTPLFDFNLHNASHHSVIQENKNRFIIRSSSSIKGTRSFSMGGGQDVSDYCSFENSSAGNLKMSFYDLSFKHDNSFENSDPHECSRGSLMSRLLKKKLKIIHNKLTVEDLKKS